ncbi:hypothetical protein BG011_001924 [Mortierella polycephala]|uniref:Uncharacterized protein n=1 Tax=Mortierella polycephala TaxID=41804 RepID=A0A9P6U5C6_9FUNG|nr:hypothetical protein BG011_001924 [Mortierella polycephala]
MAAQRKEGDPSQISNSTTSTCINLTGLNNSSEDFSSTTGAEISSTPPCPAPYSSSSSAHGVLAHIRSKSQKSISSQHQASQSSSRMHTQHHSKSGSIASVRSRLVAKASRSSLQLNLRTNQQEKNPTLAPTPSQSPGGTWDGPNLAPSPMFPIVDPAFLKEQEIQQQVQMQSGDRECEDVDVMEVVKANVGPTTVRQDEARMKLEQERAYFQTRKWKTWTWSKIALLLANTISRKVLGIYNVLLWPLFSLYITIGYIGFRRVNVDLYQDLKTSWISEYTRDDRIVIQNAIYGGLCLLRLALLPTSTAAGVRGPIPVLSARSFDQYI